jgi:predicted permease
VTITEIPQEYDTRATSIAADDEMVGRKSPALRYWRKFLDWMNPPLWSMVFAIIVASIPAAKYELYEKNGFVANTVGSAITQVGKLAIPLILIVLGSNLAPDTSLGTTSPHHNKIVFASLLCRMVLPSLLLLPVIACSVKYLSVSILDDPIFLLVAFILTVSPPAIQLSQICQLNGVFEKEMASVLFWGYVVLTLPSTIIIVVSSLEVLNWAGVTGS